MIGKSIAHYSITGKLGEGGMGEVYRATDTKLNREVALKILPEQFAADGQRMTRFEREAQVLASLNHPNIGSIHGIEDTGTTKALVLELIEGPTLADRIDQGRIEPGEALPIALQIAEALDAAHAKGIIHRDLKPANIKLTQEGQIKVLDFGLARVAEPDPDAESPDLTRSPTLTRPATQAGVIMGTAAYMAPEQARGKQVDKRADIWAFGVVLYQMLAGQAPFKGEDFSEILAAVLATSPDLTLLPKDTPSSFVRVIRRCLERDPKERLRDIGDARYELMISPEPDHEASASPGRLASRGVPWGWAAFGALVLVSIASGVAWWLTPQASPPQEVVRFDIVLPNRWEFSANFNRVLAISPDGRHIAFNAESRLWLRPIDQLETFELRGTSNARTPFFSPDSRQLGFWADGQIKRTGLDGGVPAPVASFRERPFGASWGEDGFIYVGRGVQGVWRMPGSGGEPEQVISLEDGEFAHGPVLLPGGKWLLFGLARGIKTWKNGSIVAQSLEDGKRKTLIERGREPRYAHSGHLLYVQDTELFAVAFDVGSVELTGGPSSMDVSVNLALQDETGAADYDISRTGTLIHRPNRGSGLFELVWRDHDGGTEKLPLEALPITEFRLSPDDRRVAVQVDDADGSHIWIYRVDRGGGQRLTSAGSNRSPVWSPDGEWIYFSSDRAGNFDIWRRRADRGSRAEVVLESEGDQVPNSISADGRWLFFTDQVPSNGDIRRVSLQDDRVVEPLVQTNADEFHAMASPDGRYFAYQTNEDPRWDIQVMDTITESRWTVSSGGGYGPIWSKDGSRIFYNYDDEIYAAQVSVDQQFRATAPQVAFDFIGGNGYDVTTDGSRLLTNIPSGWTPSDRYSLDVVLSWFEELEPRR